jgi:hypothetical protein
MRCNVTMIFIKVFHRRPAARVICAQLDERRHARGVWRQRMLSFRPEAGFQAPAADLRRTTPLCVRLTRMSR